MSGATVAFGRTEKAVYAAGEPIGTAVLDASAGCWTFEPSEPGAWSEALAAASWDSLAELGSDVALAAPGRVATEAAPPGPDYAGALARLVDAVDEYEAEMDRLGTATWGGVEGAMEDAAAVLARSRDAEHPDAARLGSPADDLAFAVSERNSAQRALADRDARLARIAEIADDGRQSEDWNRAVEALEEIKRLAEGKEAE